MRILLAVHHFPPNHIGGAELQAYRMASSLRNLGHTVQVMCVEPIKYATPGKTTYREDIYRGVPVRRLLLNLAAIPAPLRWDFCNPIIEQQCRDLLVHFKPDIVHLVSGYLISGSALSVAQSARVPTVLMAMDFWLICPRITLLKPDESLCAGPSDPFECLLCLNNEKRRYRIPHKLSAGLLDRFLYRLWQLPRTLDWMGQRDRLLALQERRTYLRQVVSATHALIVNSRFLQNMLKEQGFRPYRYVQMRQGLDISPWQPSEKKVSNPISGLRIGYIGQIAKHKGVHILIRAFQNLKPGMADLVIYGDLTQAPDYVRELRHLANGNARIQFAGTFDHNEIAGVHAELDLLVVPSLWYENSPNVILEAFAFGTPVITSDIGGMAELVQSGGGTVFKMGDVDDLTDRLQYIIDHPEWLERMRSSMPAVRTIEEEITELVDIYCSIR